MSLQTQVFAEIKHLSPNILPEILDFVRFLRFKEVTDPKQAYFWTKRWQNMEKAIEKDKKHGRIVGNGTVKGLVKILGK